MTKAAILMDKGIMSVETPLASLGGASRRLEYHPCAAGESTARTPHQRHESSMPQQKSPLEKRTLMSVKRLELLTNGLKGRCSTIELHARRRTFYHAPPVASTDISCRDECLLQ